MSFPASTIRDALRRLTDADPVMASLVAEVGPFRMKLHRDRFRTLVRAIISQQISARAAESIGKRLTALAGPGGITARRLAFLSPEDLRSAGVSPQKARYLADLANKVSSGTVRLDRIGQYSDSEVIQELTQVTGIGEWTAQMFLMFCLGRLDVLPHGDLGIRTAVARLYRLRELPGRQEIERIASRWRPYATVACWYCWRSLETGGNGGVAPSRRENQKP